MAPWRRWLAGGLVVLAAQGVLAGMPAADEATPPPERPPWLARLREDALALGSAPGGWRRGETRRLGLAVAAVAGTMLLDEEIREVVQRHRSASGDRVAEAIRPLGNRAGALALIATLWASGRLSGEERLTAMGEDAFEGTLFAAALLTPILKRTVGRARPVAEEGAFRFEPFSSYQSFPSGEATQAFVIASVVAAHSDRSWVDALAWSYAAAIAWQRLNLDRHWASDVVAGALIGTGVGRWVVRRRQPGSPPAQVTVFPVPVANGFGVSLAARW